MSVAELEANLDVYLERVRRGEELLVRDRDVSIARIVPVPPSKGLDAELASLVLQGKLRLGRGRLPRSFWALPAPRVSREDALRVLGVDRDER